MFSLDLVITPDERDMCDAWREASRQLGFEFTSPFTVHIDGRAFEYLGLVHSFGARDGTLIATMHSDSLLADHATPDGFYVSALNPCSYSTFHRDHFIATLDDWRWFGPEDKKPSWYTGTPWSA